MTKGGRGLAKYKTHQAKQSERQRENMNSSPEKCVSNCVFSNKIAKKEDSTWAELVYNLINHSNEEYS